jgi:two-component system OmpR family response regulator
LYNRLEIRKDVGLIKILMIEDDCEINMLLEKYLRRFNIIATSTTTPTTALKFLDRFKFDLILLDLGLPEIDGLELCRELKERYPDIPIIISTARVDVTDKVIAFDNGADDYMPKPYEPRELVARIEALIKRYQNSRLEMERLKGDFQVDKSTMQILYKGKPIHFTLAEYEIFSLLIERKGEVVSREELIKDANSLKWESSERSIDVIISRIRSKIKDSSKNPKYIKSIRGIGYKYIGK